MTFRSPKLLKASKDQFCVRCGKTDNVIGAHYTGVRRLNFGGGYGIKVHDFLTADLCQECHYYMDTLSRDKEKQYEHSEEFLYYIALTWERRFVQGVLVVARNRDASIISPHPENDSRGVPALESGHGASVSATHGPGAGGESP